MAPESILDDPDWSYGTVYLREGTPQGPSEVEEKYPGRITGYIVVAESAVHFVTFSENKLCSDDIYPMHMVLRVSFHVGHPANVPRENDI